MGSGSVGVIVAQILLIALGIGLMLVLGVRQSGLRALIERQPRLALPGLAAIFIGLLGLVGTILGWFAFLLASATLIALALVAWRRQT